MWTVETLQSANEAGPDSKLYWITSDTVSLGRPLKGSAAGQADIVLTGDSAVSKIHAYITTKWDDGRLNVCIKDISRYGTWINDVRVEREVETEVKSGDVVKLAAKIHLRFKWAELKVLMDLSAPSMTQAPQQLRTLGLSLQHEWCSDISYVVHEDAQPATPAVMCAALLAKPVVRLSWLEALSQQRCWEALPDAGAHCPALLSLPAGQPTSLSTPSGPQQCSLRDMQSVDRQLLQGLAFAFDEDSYDAGLTALVQLLSGTVITGSVKGPAAHQSGGRPVITVVPDAPQEQAHKGTAFVLSASLLVMLATGDRRGLDALLAKASAPQPAPTSTVGRPASLTPSEPAHAGSSGGGGGGDGGDEIEDLTEELDEDVEALPPAPPASSPAPSTLLNRLGSHAGAGPSAPAAAHQRGITKSGEAAGFGAAPVLTINPAALVKEWGTGNTEQVPARRGRQITAFDENQPGAGVGPAGGAKRKRGAAAAAAAPVAPAPAPAVPAAEAALPAAHETVGPGHAVLYLPLAVQAPAAVNAAGQPAAAGGDVVNFKRFRKSSAAGGGGGGGGGSRPRAATAAQRQPMAMMQVDHFANSTTVDAFLKSEQQKATRRQAAEELFAGKMQARRGNKKADG
mmetsp:Transcript_20183/g.43988  ORF Transcript_20183/g.43988 Transcript_20183/m.43988 type:complete len:627 (-) Transcript_20183:380-2260(-)|eukprot:CAMPEP_0202898384 /NCGR_PEP_ID=MMETSP1392-20130828/6920_1 /ASSEMBLY_ACC=CAM_ASM_000868 /TAXON_ID=225041 /ORGANISM="Chlamydomonas chlamydogama, Strain SAG 11-48b" /LENGTH=626 /DNA_ID=CAMNT_0049584295 /DNA_START=41 /DNA_END=1921 /DNA_ORIENTATION=+